MLSKEEIENKEELLKRISKEQYGDEWFIEKAILSYKNQKEKTYTFFRDDEEKDLLKKYNWCQRPCSSNMSLDRFVINGEIEGYMSESLAEHLGLVQVDLNEFIHKFVKLIIKENLLLKNKINQLEQENNKLNKMIDEMVKVMIDSSICDYFINDNCKHYAGENKKLCKSCIKQHFEKKAEEKN